MGLNVDGGSRTRVQSVEEAAKRCWGGKIKDGSLGRGCFRKL